MDAAYALAQLGGCATTARLRRFCRRSEIEQALSDGAIVRCGKGKYAVPGLDAAWREAHRLSAVVSGRSAAQFWELDLCLAPGEEVTPELTVPRNRKIAPERREGVSIKWRNLPAASVVEVGRGWGNHSTGRVTTLVQTVLDCCRDLPERDALCVVDAALRKGQSRTVLLAAALELPAIARSRVRRVIEQGDGRSANAFETCLRHIARSVPGLDVVAQVQIGEHRVDLADAARKIVVEAESFAFHGSKEMFRVDCRRYTWLTTTGWIVWRFVWEDVMLKPDEVRVAMVRGLAIRSTCSCGGFALS
ncbi:DUF559 domain-containing protein [Nocardioides sp. JQ2195]|uniref:DUF559 domain-containing protein n=1 Tax=Nocardioides sp. JQ2195 TaxID=2592334 RepID=UPI00143E9B2B|nr:DUF559 domain-containing protein [Nocardioides sp. JQ2195]QIX28019.1 DUF559 domain-containing protein [Nocardioides sp. JQ2195]